ncbi:hypothetical protein GCM10009821_27600 [Aeromicrobium halocynthiae]|uniref:Uncharacterized protein n=1 Tax=Aeromicrobium halocynthiae TaxID=560557 RepID=A0ABP5HUU9_9ACTN
MSDKSLLKRAGGKVASLHQMDRRLRAKAVAVRQGEKDLAALEGEVRAARERGATARPGTVI